MYLNSWQLPKVSHQTQPWIERQQQRDQMAMAVLGPALAMGLAPIVTDVVSSLLPQVGRGNKSKFLLPGNSRMIGLPNHH